METESKTIQILLVEDDEDDYLILKECLLEQSSPSKFKLDWVQSYQEGLRQILRARHDICLIDYYLGENSGLDLLKEAVQAGCQAPFIIVTGQSDRVIDQAVLMAGATDYLEKNAIDGQLLERSIRYALERNRLVKQIREMAVRDALTGLFNRRELHRFLDYEVTKSKRYHHPFSVLMMDVDHFKEVNDRFGHRTGDNIIQQVAQGIQDNIRGCDLPARYGGDEFIIVLPETSAKQAWYAAERLRKTVMALPIQVSNKDGVPELVEITISTGVAEFPGDTDSDDTLIDLADQALYSAKHEGCNKVVLFETLEERNQGG